MSTKGLNGSSTCADVRKALGIPSYLNNATVIVTGASTGLGKKTTQHLSYLGVTVILACRNLQKAEDAISEIRADKECDNYGLKGENLKLFALKLDLSSLGSVRDFVREFKVEQEAKQWPPLKLLVLNAGMVGLDGFKVNEDGLESTFVTNHLGHFLLTNLLLEELRRNAPSRVVVLSSHSHYGPLATKNVENTEEVVKKIVKPSKSQYGFLSSYGSSKLCNVLFSKELQQLEKLRGSNVSICSLHPGAMIATDVMRGSVFLKLFTDYVLSWFTKNIDQGCSTTLYACLAKSEDIEGKYLSDCHVVKESNLATDKASKVLWQISNDLTKKYLE